MGEKSSKFDVRFDPLWYKDAVIYEAHVRAFYDSNGDGYGDFRGLTEKLDYLQELGITALWLLPFYPSPLRDDGYDIANYKEIHPLYGTVHDFRTMLRAAHRRGIKVICELVVNHTSDQHPWFQRARRAKAGSSARPTATRMPASSSRTMNRATGPGTTRHRPITGTDSSPTSPI